MPVFLHELLNRPTFFFQWQILKACANLAVYGQEREVEINRLKWVRGGVVCRKNTWWIRIMQYRNLKIYPFSDLFFFSPSYEDWKLSPFLLKRSWSLEYVLAILSMHALGVNLSDIYTRNIMYQIHIQIIPNSDMYFMLRICKACLPNYKNLKQQWNVTVRIIGTSGPSFSRHLAKRTGQQIPLVGSQPFSKHTQRCLLPIGNPLKSLGLV